MKVQWTKNDFGRSGILAVPEAGDSHPVLETYYMDYLIENLDQDRLAIAAALVFGSYSGNRLSFTGRVSSEVARAIEAFHRTDGVRVEPVSYGENHSPHGDSILHMSSGHKHTTRSNRIGQQRRLDVALLPTDKNSGALLTMDSLDVATNSWLHSEFLPQPYADDLCKIASGVLLSTDLSAAGVAICRSGKALPAPVLSGAQRLLDSVGLTLGMAECAEHLS
ncbi:hypothetical protein LN996_15400 [Arthrobacter sp. AK01]|uniref:hypothetical protein n=1 Tax=Arthrobacter sp. AK01 TaxID=2894084 RepID=UPI001E581C45|nr:hypothetical protein [Arthrobacter sp. AK01]MCD4852202.1 hypothetical protein [Arthrobacter sp. AK01]